MLESDPVLLDAHGLGGNDKLLLTLSQHLCADHTGKTGPAEQAQNNHDDEDSGILVYRHGPYDVGQHHGKWQEGQRREYLCHAHEQHIHPAAEVSGETAHDNGDDGGNHYSHRADGHGHFAAVDNTGEDITAAAVGAQGVPLEAHALYQLILAVDHVGLLGACVDQAALVAVHVALAAVVMAPGIYVAAFAHGYKVPGAGLDLYHLLIGGDGRNILLAVFSGAEDHQAAIVHDEAVAVVGSGDI